MFMSFFHSMRVPEERRSDRNSGLTSATTRSERDATSTNATCGGVTLSSAVQAACSFRASQVQSARCAVFGTRTRSGTAGGRHLGEARAAPVAVVLLEDDPRSVGAPLRVPREVEAGRQELLVASVGVGDEERIAAVGALGRVVDVLVVGEPLVVG